MTPTLSHPKSTRRKGETVLLLKDIHKTFAVGKNEVEIIKGVSFEINQGDFVILFGPSGCGKSTILNILLGLEPPTSGTVQFLNEELYDRSEDERSELRKTEVGMVYQQSNWIKSLNVVENVSFPLALLGVSRAEREAQAIEKLRIVGLEGSAYQKPGELSSGQQQRVSLARALISDPTLIVADEPTGNLDSTASGEIMQLFKTFNEQEKTVIMVTHDLEYLRFASRAIQMTDGAVVKIYDAGDPELRKHSVSKRGTMQSRGEVPSKTVGTSKKGAQLTQSNQPSPLDQSAQSDLAESTQETTAAVHDQPMN